MAKLGLAHLWGCTWCLVLQDKHCCLYLCSAMAALTRPAQGGLNQLRWPSCQLSSPKVACFTPISGFLYLLSRTELSPAATSSFVMGLLGSLELDLVKILILEVQWCLGFWEKKPSMLLQDTWTEFLGVPACALWKVAWKYLLKCLESKLTLTSSFRLPGWNRTKQREDPWEGSEQNQVTVLVVTGAT